MALEKVIIFKNAVTNQRIAVLRLTSEAKSSIIGGVDRVVKMVCYDVETGKQFTIAPEEVLKEGSAWKFISSRVYTD